MEYLICIKINMFLSIVALKISCLQLTYGVQQNRRMKYLTLSSKLMSLRKHRATSQLYNFFLMFFLMRKLVQSSNFCYFLFKGKTKIHSFEHYGFQCCPFKFPEINLTMRNLEESIKS